MQLVWTPKLGMLIAIATAMPACANGVRRFPLAPPMWEDTDRNHVPEKPSKQTSWFIADGIDQTVLLPLAEAASLPGHVRAVNVNAFDEVPDSAWFTNRIGREPLTPEQAARGPCTNPPPDPREGPWVVTRAKPDGANPGFFIKTPDGRRFLLKFDGAVQPLRASAADVIGSKIYWLAGFNVPCNTIVDFDVSILALDPEAKAKNRLDQEIPLTKEHVDGVLSAATRNADGTLRAVASEFVPGEPLGPWTYDGLRDDDPNDVIPHEDRRELRASRILAAWINHFDSREQNTLDVWTKAGDRRFIAHYFIDFGDSLGGRWNWDPVSRRLGHSYYIDFAHIFVDLFTLGLWPRAWHEVEMDEDVLGYFESEHFVASDWKPGYRNPAFSRMDELDALWMARIIQRISAEHIHAIVDEARIRNPRAADLLAQVLIERRRKILAEYLTEQVPLDRFEVLGNDGSQRLCFEDLAIAEGLAAPREVFYKMRMLAGGELDEEIGWAQIAPGTLRAERTCVALPVGVKRPHELAPEGAPADDPLRYGVLRIFVHQTTTVLPASSIELHFYDLGPKEGMQLVGIVRPPSPSLPEVY